ncbi:MAG: M23 family metallopeptidase [Oscillospiraceae bacterium]|nr:M23 family metallopeptidase [Oscillospiraceae bacterium]
MSQSGKLIAVAVLLSLLAILSGVFFGREKIPEIRNDMDVWVSRQDQNILHRLSDSEKALLIDILSHQQKLENGGMYDDFVLSFAAYKDGDEVLQPSLYRLTDGTNEFVMKYPDDSCYSLDTRSVLQLLTSDTLDGLFDYIENAPSMTVTQKSQSLTLHCIENGWQYKKIDNSIFMDGVLVQDGQTLLDAADGQDIGLSFSVEPQTVQIEISLIDRSEIVFAGDADQLRQFSPPISALYRMQVTAEWTETATRRYSGRCLYALVLQVKKEAEVFVSENKVMQGGLLEVTVTNPEDPGSLRVTTDLGQAGPFVKQEEGFYTCLVVAQNAGSYPLFVSGTGVSGEHQIEVIATTRDEQVQQDFPLLREAGEGAQALQSFEETWLALGKTAATDKYWNGLFQPPLAGDPVLGFGQRFSGQPDQMDGTFWWQVEEDTQVMASNVGIVAFVGELDSGGRAVAIHHGLGLYTWYYGLTETLVEQGDVILSGEILGSVLPEDDIAWCGVQATLSGAPLDLGQLWEKPWLESPPPAR